MMELTLDDILPKGLDYLKNTGARLAYHPIETTTCQEKADLIGWPAERVIKALYYTRGDDLALGIVIPEIGRKIDTKDIAAILGITSSQAKKYRNGHAPEMMSRGTCTPFIQEAHLTPAFRGIYFDESSIERLADYPVDFSIGLAKDPHESISKRLSIQMPYGAAYELVKQTFPDYAHITKIFQ